MKYDQNLNGTGIAKLSSGESAETMALRALAYVAGDADLGPRLLELTGLDASGLRARAADSAVLAATLQFLAAHEPSLVACAAALDVRPSALIDAERYLSEHDG